MGFLQNLFGTKPGTEQQFVVASLNARLQPLDRGHWFEDPLGERLQALEVGEIAGGGTMMFPTGEVQYCDVEIVAASFSPENLDVVIEELEKLGAPRGSTLRIESNGSKISFGVTEGLALYLNGVDLPDEVYKTSDVDFVCAEFDRLLAGKGRYLSFWQGPTETALYLYGDSFDEMTTLLRDFVNTYPLCQRCRIEQIA